MTIEGVTDVLKKRKTESSASFTVCLHHFWDVTWNWCMENWKARFPGDHVRTLLYGSDHAEAWRLRRIQKLRKAMYDPLTARYIDKEKQ